MTLLGSFGVIFFYQQFDNSFTKVIVLRFVLFGIFMLLLPIGAKFFKRVGFEPLMRFAMPFLALSMLSLYLFDKTDMAAWIGLYIVTLTIFRLTYWMPYHIDYAKLTNNKSRGKQLAIMSNIEIIFSAVIPIFTGFVIARYGFSPIFLISIIVVLASIIPLLSLETTYEEYSFSYWESFKKLFAKKNRSLFLSHFSRGTETAVSGVIWPIYIFIAFNEEYTTFGIIASLSVLSLVLLRAFVGYLDDIGKKQLLLKISGFLGASSWILKMFVDTPTEVFAADTYYNTGRASQDMAYTHTMYEHAADNGSYIDEYTVFRELSLNFGRLFILLISVPIVIYFPPQVTFIVAAIASLFVSSESSEKCVN
ncbi:hypothetical protein KC901_01595 [Patescibacteria group bacterium]|nr:hypothetical protein [Patescibacteria group bacterium]